MVQTEKNLEMNNWALESYTLQAPPGGMGGWHAMRCQEAMLLVDRRHGTPLYHMQGGKVHKAFVAVPICRRSSGNPSTGSNTNSFAS